MQETTETEITPEDVKAMRRQTAQHFLDRRLSTDRSLRGAHGRSKSQGVDVRQAIVEKTDGTLELVRKPLPPVKEYRAAPKNDGHDGIRLMNASAKQMRKASKRIMIAGAHALRVNNAVL